MAYAPGLFGRSAVTRSAYVGPSLTPNDVVRITDKYGRVVFLGDQHIDLKKGKAYDARLQMPSENISGPNPLPAGGVRGRQASTGVRSILYPQLGITNRINLTPNIKNTY